MFQKALISTDLEDGLYRLAYTIPSLVESGFKDITFFHNVPVETDRSVPRVDEDEVAAAQTKLKEVIQEVPDGVDVKVLVSGGRASSNILQTVEETGCEVLFLGMPTRNILSEKLFGSTTMKLVERTPVPMMILRPHLISTFTTEELSLRCRHLFHYLLIPYDGTAGSTEFLEALKARIQQNPPPADHQYWLLWVIDDNIRRELQGDRPMEDARQRLEKAAEMLRELNLKVETLVVEGDPLTEILRAADRHDIGAIATSSRGIGGLLRWSVPSLTREILRHSWHPVLYFPKAD
ncbi:universal stress protein [Leptolyngbya iicbica]|uniref:Universal stress protein n=2 Tax=Cyanophyceae TaxID=3028117 RepID=A0A4Q7E2A9_9CYAN|nr:universal stress protein [Leptolyngbya sp. LK]RZM75384.1 universal stress protein [Leptolyngbya sp. LK]